jgi:thiamine biosynthesis lipoprotein
MRETRAIMGMPITVEIIVKAGPLDARKGPAFTNDRAIETIESVFEYFTDIDERFSTYKETSEISMINRGEIAESAWSEEMQEAFRLAEATKRESNGYFDINKPDATIDPSGIVKGLAIQRASEMLARGGYEDFFIDAGGDIASAGKNTKGSAWSVGIKNPFKQDEIVKAIYPHGHGVATSGSYIRGAHIYDPHDPARSLDEIVSITVIGPDVLEADRFATAAFAMQRNGIRFIEGMPDLEGYMIDKDGMATMTSGFEQFTNL